MSEQRIGALPAAPAQEELPAARAAPRPSAARRPWAGLVAPAKRIADHMAGMGRFELVALMLLLTVLLHSPGPINAAVGIVAVVGVLFRPVTRLPALWLALSVLLAANAALVWFELFNHNYLILYGCLALGIALMTPDPDRVLASTARYLLALVFLFAAFYKAISPDFPSGDFFEFTLITDERFRDLAEVIGGLPADAGAANLGAIREWGEGTRPPGVAGLETGPRIGLLADAMAIWTLFIEGAIGVLFLAARTARIGRFTEIVLLLFVATTYVLAPVVGFGWILLVLGLAQTRLPRRVAHVVYPAVFIALPLFTQTDEVWRIPRLLLSVPLPI